jgi:cytochrome c553
MTGSFGPAVLALLLAAAPVAAQDAQAGRQKARSCVGCHGARGISTAETFPNLAGQHATYLGIAMRAYRDGQRQHEVMTLAVANLSDRDIDDIAAWYASQSPVQ